MSGNTILPLPNGAARQVDFYVRDVERPRLLLFSFNLTSEMLILTFVDISTINIPYLTLFAEVAEEQTASGSGSGSADSGGGMTSSSGSATSMGSRSGSGMQNLVTMMVTSYALAGVRALL